MVVLDWVPPGANLEARNVFPKLTSKERSETKKGRKLIKGILISKLPLWATGAQSDWGLLGESRASFRVVSPDS